jgi:hypothetical protein
MIHSLLFNFHKVLYGKVNIKFAVTGVMLWDGPIDGIATYDYITEEDWTKNICDC